MKSFDAFKQHGDVIWSIANLLRGPYRPPQYRRVMIPLTVLRRLDCVLKPTKDLVIAEHKKLKAEGKYDAETIEKMINRKFKLTFHNILTLDADLANMLRFPPAGTPGVIRSKIHPPKEEAVREQIQRALKLLADTPMAGCLAVSHGDRIRG